MSELSIRVLGGLEVAAGGTRALDLPTRKSRAFLAYLALSPGMTRSREHLAAVFWERSAEEQARASLRQTLSSLRRALSGADPLVADADAIRLDARALEVDALRFERLAGERSVVSLEDAVALYRGELLSGFGLNEERFEQWLAAERRRLHECAVQAFSDLVARHMHAGHHERALAVAERLVALEPLLEWGHCALIRLYLAAGRREAALRQYRTCARTLQEELGIAPAPETERLVAEIAHAAAPPRPAAAVAPPTWVASAPAAEPAVAALPAERKQVTVLCAHLREASASADPESALASLDPALRAMMEAVRRFGGIVSQVRGDGLTALFGAPIAQEDHAVRACYAALAMRDAAAGGAQAPDLRIGIHSGEAVVRAIGDEHARHYDAVGPVPRRAGAIGAALAPGEVAVTDETARRAEGFVVLGEAARKAIADAPEPVALRALRAKAPLRLRWDARATRALARFVGREAEIARLGEALARACQGTGQVVTVVGEPGMGKSRLVHEFIASPPVADCTVLKAGTSSHETSATYLAVAHLLRAWCGIEERDTLAQADDKLHRRLEALDAALAPLAPPLAALLDLPSRDAHWATYSPPQRRQRTLEAVKGVVMRQSQARPLVLVIEDMHWADPGTQAVLDQLVDSIGACRVLLLVTHRPEYRHGWFSRSYFTQLRLDPLASATADRLLGALLGDAPELRDLRRQLIERTGGTPLFLEESVRALADAGALSGRPGAYRLAGPVDAGQIPSSVHAVIAARIDRLPVLQKSVLQTAAVIGQDVPVELLAAIADLDAESLHDVLGALQAAELLYQTRLLPAPEYTFKHALTHRVAYESVLRERRRALHRRLLDIIETRYADRLDEHVERLAHHALGAEERPQAVQYLYRSATKALQRSAHTQALRYLQQGLASIGSLPDARERSRRELDYHKAVGVAMMAAKGWAAEEVLDAYTRARALAEELGDERELFIALRGEGQYRMIRGQSDIARRLGERCLGLAARSKRVEVRLETHHLFWTNSFFMGAYAEALAHCAEGVSLYRAERDHALTFLYSGHDPGVCCRSFTALIECLSGRADRALATCRDTLALAQRLGHPLTTAIACYACSLAHVLRGEPDAVQGWAERVIEISENYLLPLTLGQGILHAGWALAQLGELEQGIARMREGMARLRATGARMDTLYFGALLGEALGRAGAPKDGLVEVERALAAAEPDGARFQVSEMLRVKGELLAVQSASNLAEAQACLRAAVATADAQGAQLPRLRAALALARLLLRKGGAAKARKALQPAYAAIAEGRDTADFRAAAALLAELGQR